MKCESPGPRSLSGEPKGSKVYQFPDKQFTKRFGSIYVFLHVFLRISIVAIPFFNSLVALSSINGECQ